MTKKTFTLIEVLHLTGLDHETINSCIASDWISPLSIDSLDIEDVARLQLIAELRNDFGANDESVPLILHLVDQLYHLQNLICEREDKS